MIEKTQSATVVSSAKVGKSEDLAPEEAKKLKEAANEFEAIFVNLMLKSMRDSVQKSGLLDGGNGEDIFRSMLDNEYSKSMAAERKTSIADAIEREMKSLLVANGANARETKGIEAYQKQIRQDPSAASQFKSELKIP